MDSREYCGFYNCMLNGFSNMYYVLQVKRIFVSCIKTDQMIIDALNAMKMVGNVCCMCCVSNQIKTYGKQ